MKAFMTIWMAVLLGMFIGGVARNWHWQAAAQEKPAQETKAADWYGNQFIVDPPVERIPLHHLTPDEEAQSALHVFTRGDACVYVATYRNTVSVAVMPRLLHDGLNKAACQ